MQLEGARAVVQAVVVEAKFAEGDERGWAATATASRGDEGAQAGDDVCCLGWVGGLVVRDGGVGVWVAGWCVLCFLVLAVAVVRGWVGCVEDSGGAGVDSCCGVDGPG